MRMNDDQRNLTGRSRQVLRVAAVGAFAAFAVTPALSHGATLAWDADTTTTGAQDGGGTLNAAGDVKFWNGTADVALTNTNPSPDDVVFGAGSGAAGTVNITPNTFIVGSLTFNAAGSGNYTLGTTNGNTVFVSSTAATQNGIVVNSSATISAPIRFINIANNGGAFAIASAQTLTLSGGGGGNNTQNALNSNVQGGGTLSLTAGQSNWGNGGSPQIINGSTTTGGLSIGGTAVMNLGGDNVGGGGQVSVGFVTAAGLMTVSTGGSFVVPTTSGSLLQIGRINNGVVNISGGSINIASASREGIRINRQSSASGVLNISGGSVTTAASGAAASTGAIAMNFLNQAAGGTATINLSGTGVLSTPLLELNSTGGGLAAVTAGSSTVNVSGGTAYLGSVVNQGTAASTYAINLSGGTLGAQSSGLSSALNMTLTNTNGGVTFLAADAGGTARNITLTGTLGGAGGLTKTGTGALLLGGPNTYLGDTTVSTGTLTLNGTAPTELSDLATLSLASGTTLNLNALTGTEIVNGLIIGGTPVAANVYTAAQLNALALGATFASGSGETLTVLSTVPEPALVGVLAIGAAGLLRRRTRIA